MIHLINCMKILSSQWGILWQRLMKRMKVDHGAKHVTHLYNAATPFEHRDPGVFGAAWTNEQLNTEIIVDGIHSHPASVHIAYKQKEMNTCISSLMRCVRKEWKTVNMI